MPSAHRGIHESFCLTKAWGPKFPLGATVGSRWSKFHNLVFQEALRGVGV